jgi:UDP-N-acetylglucosamine 2-epimerase
VASRTYEVRFIFGTRPAAIKLAPVVQEFKARREFDCKICVIGQHREMLAQVLEFFDLRPDWDLELMRPDQDLAYLAGAALSGLSEALAGRRPRSRHRAGRHDDDSRRRIGWCFITRARRACRSRSAHREYLFALARRGQSSARHAHRRSAFRATARVGNNLGREGVGAERILETGNAGIDALQWVSVLCTQTPMCGGRSRRCAGTTTSSWTATRGERSGNTAPRTPMPQCFFEGRSSMAGASGAATNLPRRFWSQWLLSHHRPAALISIQPIGRDTAAVGIVLVVNKLQAGSERYRNVADFVKGSLAGFSHCSNPAFIQVARSRYSRRAVGLASLPAGGGVGVAQRWAHRGAIHNQLRRWSSARSGLLQGQQQ